MIDINLAVKLKEAGFPQELGNDKIHRFMDCSGPYAKYGTRNPLLSELIEACVKISQDGDFHLEAMHGRWGASTCWKHKKDEWENGDTPEEAVANLWLKLNKK